MILLLFTAYLGLVVGCIISNFTKEELKNPKYLKIARPIVFFGIFFFFLNDLQVNHVLSALISLISFIPSTILEIKFQNQTFVFYAFFPIALSFMNPATAILVFLYGILTSSIIASQMLENSFFDVLKVSLISNITYLPASIFVILL